MRRATSRKAKPLTNNKRRTRLMSCQDYAPLLEILCDGGKVQLPTNEERFEAREQSEMLMMFRNLVEMELLARSLKRTLPYSKEVDRVFAEIGGLASVNSISLEQRAAMGRVKEALEKKRQRSDW